LPKEKSEKLKKSGGELNTASPNKAIANLSGNISPDNISETESIEHPLPICNNDTGIS